MPNQDGTGPTGQGRGQGRGRGPCGQNAGQTAGQTAGQGRGQGGQCNRNRQGRQPGGPAKPE
jgi:hypothetical protein